MISLLSKEGKLTFNGKTFQENELACGQMNEAIKKHMTAALT